MKVFQSRLDDAVIFATQAHESIKQVRKYTGEPYMNHSLRVIEILKRHNVFETKILQATANHDVPEDVYPLNPEYSLNKIIMMFGIEVGRIVNDVTNVYTSAAFPQYNRAERNKQEAARLALIGLEGKMIKFADIIDNVTDIKVNDPKFAIKYIEEKAEVLDYLMLGTKDHAYSPFYSLYREALSVVNS